MQKNTQLKDTVSSFITSYAERSSEVGFSEWLEQKLQQEIPDLSQEASRKLTGEIIQAVADYDNTLSELNAAVESGQSADEWLAEKLEEDYKDIPQDAAGEKLSQIEEAYAVSNVELMESDNDMLVETTAVVEDAEISWNKYSLKSKAYDIGKQVAMNGLAVAATALKNKVENHEKLNLSEAVSDRIQDGLIEDTSEVKAVVAGAMKAVAEKGLEKALPSNTPTECICDMAGTAVEGAKALYEAATGKITFTEALGKMGRAAVATACRTGKSLIEGVISKVPLVGPLVVEAASGVLEHMESPKFIDNVCNAITNVAKSTWQGIKNIGKKIFSKLGRKNKQLT